MVTVIGIGALGSFLVTNLVRLNIPVTCYDYDTVEERNLNNQAFEYQDIGCPKVFAMERIVNNINPELAKSCKFFNIRVMKKEASELKGTVFLAVDSIDARKHIMSYMKDNVDLCIEARMGEETGRVLCFNPKIHYEQWLETTFAAKDVQGKSPCKDLVDQIFVSNLLACNCIIMWKNYYKNINVVNDLNYCVYTFDYFKHNW